MKTMQIKFKNEEFGVPVRAALENPVVTQFEFRRGSEHLRGSSAIFLISLRQQHKASGQKKRLAWNAFAA